LSRESLPGGGTNINDALLASLSQFDEENNPRYIIFLTDGQASTGITDTESIVNNVTAANTAEARLYVFGLGTGVNTVLLDQLSSRNNGISMYVLPTEDVTKKITDFYHQINSPLLTNLSLDFGSIGVSDFFPVNMPDVFQNSQIVFTARYSGTGNTTVTLMGTSNGISKSYTYEVNFPEYHTDYSFVPAYWASKKIYHMLEEIEFTGLSTAHKDSIVEEIKLLGFAHGVVTPFTEYLFNQETFSYIKDSTLYQGQIILPQDSSSILDNVQDNTGLYGTLSSESGALAYDKATMMNTSKNGTQLSYFNAGTVKVQYPKIYTLDEYGLWVDSDYQKGDPVHEFIYGTVEYGKLINDFPALGQYLAIGQNLVLNWQNENFFIHDGSLGLSNTVSLKVELPKNQLLASKVYPNPFSAVTTYRYTLSGHSRIIISIYNVQGHLVRTLFSGQQKAGSHSVSWNGKNNYNNDVASGPYIVRTLMENKVLHKKIILTR